MTGKDAEPWWHPTTVYLVLLEVNSWGSCKHECLLHFPTKEKHTRKVVEVRNRKWINSVIVFLLATYLNLSCSTRSIKGLLKQALSVSDGAWATLTILYFAFSIWSGVLKYILNTFKVLKMRNFSRLYNPFRSQTSKLFREFCMITVLVCLQMSSSFLETKSYGYYCAQRTGSYLPPPFFTFFCFLFSVSSFHLFLRASSIWLLLYHSWLYP